MLIQVTNDHFLIQKFEYSTTFFKETEAFIKNVQVLNQIDEIMKIQKKVAKLESIKQMHKNKRERTNQVSLSCFQVSSIFRQNN